MRAFKPTASLSAKPSQWTVTIPDPVRRHPTAPTRITRPVRELLAFRKLKKKPLKPVLLGLDPDPDPDLDLVLGLGLGPGLGPDHVRGLVHNHVRVRVHTRDRIAQHRVRWVRRRAAPHRVQRTTMMHRRGPIRRRSGVQKIPAIQCLRNHHEAAVARRTVAIIGRGQDRRNPIGPTRHRSGIDDSRGILVRLILVKS